MDFRKIKEFLPSEKYLLTISAFVLPLYDFILATLLGRQLVFRIAHPIAIFLSISASAGFFVFLKESWDRDLKVSAILAILIAVTLPKIIVQKPVGFGERAFIYMIPTAFGLLAAIFESVLRRERLNLEIKNWNKYKAVQIGVLHAALSLEMYIINRGINFAEMISRLLENGTLITYIQIVISPLITLPLNFFIAAAPAYLYRKKKLKAPLAVFLTWFTAGFIQFFLRWNIYPVDVFYGGAKLLPPQPDYLLRPWLPLIFVIITWKLEEKYRERGFNEEAIKTS